MPVTVVLESHEPKPLPQIEAVNDAGLLLEKSCPGTTLPGETVVVASSFGQNGHAVHEDVYPSSSSFVRSAIEAWGRHSHLVLRPDDFWFTMLVQLNFYMGKNAESLRHIFVAHQGQKFLRGSGGSWEAIVDHIRAQMKENIKASWLNDWISPGFSTSSEDDERVASVLMMGLMRAFFDYSGGVICGIPSITLLGTRKDWQRLLTKLDRLKEFGSEPEQYAERLRPILSRMVSTFDDPTTTETKSFWDQIVQARVKHSYGCDEPPTQYSVSGWILGFFYWDIKGNISRQFSEGRGEYFYMRQEKSGYKYEIQYDGVQYGSAYLDDLPVGYAKAKFTFLHQDGDAIPGWVLAGSIGKSITDGAPKGYQATVKARSHMQSEETAAQEDKKEGSFCGILNTLNCFGRKPAENLISDDEKHAPKNKKQAITPDVPSTNAHSTIQPRSGWFLFYPHDEPGPFYDGDEIYGPTVDAIEACEHVEHYNTDFAD